MTIIRAAEVKNDRGGLVDTVGPVAAVWAEVKGLSGREVVMERVLQGFSVYEVRISWRSDLLQSDQLAGAAFGGRNLNILSIADPDGLRDELLIIGETASGASA